MQKIVNIMAPVLGGTALMLGVAYGWTARDYRASEIEAAQTLAASSLASADRANAGLVVLRDQLKTATDTVAAQTAEIAALQARLEADPSAAAAAAPAEPDTQVADAGPLLGDPEKGAGIYRLCSSCHQLGEGAENRTGPHLNLIFGRRAGAIDGFKYSKGMERAFDDGLVWDAEHLDAYIENPKALISGTRMSFRGIKDAQDRHDLIAYLRQFSDNPQDIPESAPTMDAPEVELPPEILAIVGDKDYGEYLASECLTCHKRDGADDGIPSITFWPTEDFVIAMHAYKKKLRPHPVMQMMAGRLDDEEIAALAAYFAELE
jgi:cytochrome c